jgi:hypothetical protein
MTRPRGKTLTQMVAEQLNEAHGKSEVGHRLAATGATGMAMDPTQPAQVGAVLEYIVAEVIALEKIVEYLAIAIETASRPNESSSDTSPGGAYEPYLEG